MLRSRCMQPNFDLDEFQAPMTVVSVTDTSVDPNQLALIRPKNEFFCEICRRRSPGRKFFSPRDPDDQEDWLFRLCLDPERYDVLKLRMSTRQIIMCNLHFPPETASRNDAGLVPPMDLHQEGNRIIFQNARNEISLQSEASSDIDVSDRRAHPEQSTITIRTQTRGRPRRTMNTPKGTYRKKNQVILHPQPITKTLSSIPNEQPAESQYVVNLLRMNDVQHRNGDMPSLSCQLPPENTIKNLITLRKGVKEEKPFVCIACSVLRRGPRFPLPTQGSGRIKWINKLALTSRDWVETLATREGQLCGLHFDPALTLGSIGIPTEPLDMRVTNNKKLFSDLYRGKIKVKNTAGHIVRANSFFLLDHCVRINDPKMKLRTNGVDHMLDVIGGSTFQPVPGVGPQVIPITHRYEKETVESSVNEPNHFLNVANEVEVGEEDEIVLGEDEGEEYLVYEEGEDGVTYISNVSAMDNLHYDEEIVDRRMQVIRGSEMRRSDFDDSMEMIDASSFGSNHIMVSKIGDEVYMSMDPLNQVVHEEVIENDEEGGEVNVEDSDGEDGLQKDCPWDRADTSRDNEQPGASDGPPRLLLENSMETRKYAVRYHRCQICSAKRVNVDLQSVSSKAEKRDRMWEFIPPDVMRAGARETIDRKAANGQSVPACQNHFPLDQQEERLRHIELAIFPNGRKSLQCEKEGFKIAPPSAKTEHFNNNNSPKEFLPDRRAAPKRFLERKHYWICDRYGKASQLCQVTKDSSSLNRMFIVNEVPLAVQDIIKDKLMNYELCLVCVNHYDVVHRPNALLDLDYSAFEPKAKKKGKAISYKEQSVVCSICNKAVSRPLTRKMTSHPQAMQMVFDYANVSAQTQGRLRNFAQHGHHAPVCKSHFPENIRDVRGRYWHRDLERQSVIDDADKIRRGRISELKRERLEKEILVNNECVEVMRIKQEEPDEFVEDDILVEDYVEVGDISHFEDEQSHPNGVHHIGSDVAHMDGGVIEMGNFSGSLPSDSFRNHQRSEMVVEEVITEETFMEPILNNAVKVIHEKISAKRRKLD